MAAATAPNPTPALPIPRLSPRAVPGPRPAAGLHPRSCVFLFRVPCLQTWQLRGPGAKVDCSPKAAPAAGSSRVQPPPGV